MLKSLHILYIYIVTKIQNKKPKIVRKLARKVFNLDLNLFISSIDLMSMGKSFQSRGAMTEKALKPYVFKL